MEKNIIVLDELGNKIGDTFSKRAKGLVKNGRAEYVDDRTIRMMAAHVPTILIDSIDNMEDLTMSKVIDFNAREFRFDETNQGQNVGSRMFITDMFNNATEVFEIGNPGAWTQICCDKVLDKETDYVFRFAISRQASYPNTTSQFIVVPNDNWEDRFVFNLSNDQFKPTAIKKWNGSDFRIYEIPFNTGYVENYRFVIVEHASTARIFPVKEVSAYDFLENSTGESSRFNIPNFNFDFDKVKPNITPEMKENMANFGKNAGETMKSAFDKISSVFENMGSSKSEEGHSMFMRMGQNFTAKELKECFDGLSDSGKVKLAGCNIQGTEDYIEWGKALDALKENVEGCNISGNAFEGLVKKFGDGSKVKFLGCNISFNGAGDDNLDVSDGSNLDLSGSVMSADALAYFLRRVGDGTNIRLDGAVINGETTVNLGSCSDGINIRAVGTVISENFKNRIISEKFGDGCNWQ